MSGEMRFAVCLSVLGNPGDRFVAGGYKKPKSLLELLEAAAKVTQAEGVEIFADTQLNREDIRNVKGKLEKTGKTPCLVMTDTFCQPKWGNGSFSSPDRKTRKEAINEVKATVDLTTEIGCRNVGIWLGQDGFDYCFQADYRNAWKRIIEGIKECADYRPDVRLCIEYKIKEPRTHIFLSTVGKMLLLINQVDKDNVGVIVDTGHLFNCYENLAESVVLLKEFGDRLFHIHLNDNWGLWDDDLVACSLHTIEYLELLYWLRETGYDGWYSLDISPCREDGITAANESIEWMKGLSRLLEKIGYEKLREAIKKQEPLKALSLLRKGMLS